ncbi:MAG: sodium:proton antiporter [Desulfobacula sp.]|jgi:multicomponent Na+:H+ antiporter subunit G|nr:sodium:proton antiporter [Desulfobacula sp.]MBT6340178.1 sodium:proton antiporter [Desulfobacula sp.]
MAIIITIMLICGLIFFAGGSIGIIRFPDFYSRLHPAGKLDTGGLAITMSAFALYTILPLTLTAIITSVKIILIVVFVFITSPTAIHSIVDAGVRAGLTPWKKSEDDSI